MHSDLLKKMGLKKQSIITQNVTEKSSLEKQINADLMKVGHKMLLEKYSQYYKDVNNIDITKIDKDSDTYGILQNRYRGYLNDLSLVEQFAEYIDTVKYLD